jgi:hypothetical protein
VTNVDYCEHGIMSGYYYACATGGGFITSPFFRLLTNEAFSVIICLIKNEKIPFFENWAALAVLTHCRSRLGFAPARRRLWLWEEMTFYNGSNGI